MIIWWWLIISFSKKCSWGELALAHLYVLGWGWGRGFNDWIFLYFDLQRLSKTLFSCFHVPKVEREYFRGKGIRRLPLMGLFSSFFTFMLLISFFLGKWIRWGKQILCQKTLTCRTLKLFWGEKRGKRTSLKVDLILPIPHIWWEALPQ